MPVTIKKAASTSKKSHANKDKYPHRYKSKTNAEYTKIEQLPVVELQLIKDRVMQGKVAREIAVELQGKGYFTQWQGSTINTALREHIANKFPLIERIKLNPGYSQHEGLAMVLTVLDRKVTALQVSESLAAQQLERINEIRALEIKSSYKSRHYVPAVTALQRTLRDITETQIRLGVLKHQNLIDDTSDIKPENVQAVLSGNERVSLSMVDALKETMKNLDSIPVENITRDNELDDALEAEFIEMDK